MHLDWVIFGFNNALNMGLNADFDEKHGSSGFVVECRKIRLLRKSWPLDTCFGLYNTGKETGNDQIPIKVTCDEHKM